MFLSVYSVLVVNRRVGAKGGCDTNHHLICLFGTTLISILNLQEMVHQCIYRYVWVHTLGPAGLPASTAKQFMKISTHLTESNWYRYIHCLAGLPAAQSILQTEGVACMFFKPDKEWLIVLPINHVMGRVPLIILILDSWRLIFVDHHLQIFQIFLHHSFVTRTHTSCTDTQLKMEQKAVGAHCLCSMCICSNRVTRGLRYREPICSTRQSTCPAIPQGHSQSESESAQPAGPGHW